MDILIDYDDALRIVSPHIAKIPEMERWLGENFAAGTLETFNSSQISRKQFYDEFGINGVTLIRHPEIAAILAPYDEKVATGGYLTKYHREKIALLLARCSSADFIDRNGSKFSWEKASREIGVSVTILNRPPFLQVIKGILKDHRNAIRANPLVVTSGGRDFSFVYLVGLGWANEPIECIARQFLTSFGGASSGWRKAVYGATNDFLRWLSSQTAHHVKHCADFARSGRSQSIWPRYWSVVHNDYGAFLSAKYPNVSSRNTRYKLTNAALEALYLSGIVPEIDLPYSSDRVTEKMHLPSLGEAVPKGGTSGGKAGTAEQYLAFAKQKFVEAAAMGHDIEVGEQNAFLENLRLEIEGQSIEPGQNPDEVIAGLMRRRLNLIEAECRRRLDASRSAFEKGQALLAVGTDPDVYWEKLFGAEVKRQTTSKILADYFPSRDISDQGVANLLAFVAKSYGSVYPAKTRDGVAEGAFFQKRARDYGGLPLLQSYLMPDMDAVGSVATLYLCASGVNIAVARTSFVDCVEPSQAKNHSSITGFKARAQGKPIYVDLLTSSAAVVGMTWLKGALGPVRKKLDADSSKLLFVVRLQGQIKGMDERCYRDFFRKVVGSIPGLAHLNLTPNMIRPTVLLLSVIDGDGSTRLSKALGQHGEGIHRGYTDKFPTMFQRDADIREFVDLFETVTLDGNERVLGLVGIGRDDLEERIKRATQTGFGVLCGDPYGKPGNEGAMCSAMNCWNGCPQIIVLAKKEDIAILILWQRSLLDVEGDWIRDRPERWLHVWLPWLTFVRTIEEKLRGRYEHVWQDAVKMADLIAAHPKYRHHRIS